MLSANGAVYLTMPNYLAYDFLEVGEIYRNLLGPAHLNYFNPRSIARLLERAGFRDAHVYCDGVLDTSIMANYHREKRKVLTGFWKHIYDRDEEYAEFLDEFQDLLRKYRLSGNMTVVARR